VIRGVCEGKPVCYWLGSSGGNGSVCGMLLDGVAVGNRLGLGSVIRSVGEDCCRLAPNQYPPNPNMVRSKTEVRIIVNRLGHLGVFNTC
jgi:hypothetical protein